jgi:hypothetical protein
MTSVAVASECDRSQMPSGCARSEEQREDDVADTIRLPYTAWIGAEEQRAAVARDGAALRFEGASPLSNEYRRPHGSDPEPRRASSPNGVSRPHGDRRRAEFPCVPSVRLQPAASSTLEGFWKPVAPPVEQPLLVTIADAARLLSISEGSIRNLVKRKELIPVRIGGGRGMLRFRRADIAAIAGVTRKETDA